MKYFAFFSGQKVEKKFGKIHNITGPLILKQDNLNFPNFFAIGDFQIEFSRTFHWKRAEGKKCEKFKSCRKYVSSFALSFGPTMFGNDRKCLIV